MSSQGYFRILSVAKFTQMTVLEIQPMSGSEIKLTNENNSVWITYKYTIVT